MTQRWARRAEATEVSDERLNGVDAWWRAANYLSVGQIYLLRNPLLREPLSRDDVKPRLLGHWGTTPGLTFLYAHLNRVIAERSQRTLYIAGRGMAALAWSPTPTSTAPTRTSTRGVAR